MKRLLILLVAIGVVWYLVRHYAILTPTGLSTAPANPVDRARAAASASNARTSAGEAAGREADQPGGGAVTENMTPDQVRALLGAPDDTSTETLGSGATRETWTYRSVGKSVVFENGVVKEIH